MKHPTPHAQSAGTPGYQSLAAVLENSSDLISILGADGTVRYASPSHERLLGYSPAQLVGRSGFDLIHPEDVPRVLSVFGRFLPTPGVAPSVEFRFRHRDGSWRVFEAIGNNLLADPAVAGVVVNSRDVTARKRAEQHTAALLEISRTVTGTLELEELLARVERQTAEVLPCDVVTTFFWDQRSQVFRLISQYGAPADMAADLAAIELPVGHSFAARLAGGQTVVVRNTSDEQWLPADLSRDHRVGAFIAAPLVVRGHSRGAVVAIALAARSFDAGQVELCEGIARHVAVAIEVAQRYRAEKEEAVVAGALARVGQALITSIDQPVLLDRLCELTTEVLDCDCSHTFLLRPGDDDYVPMSHHGDTPERWEALRVLRLPRPLIAELLDYLAARGMAWVAVEDSPPPVPASLLHQLDVTAALIAPIQRGSETVGLLIAGVRGRPARFTSAHERIASGVGHLAALALANAALVDELARASRLKSDFVATMSHELRTPLHIILGYNDLLLDGAFDADIERGVEVLQRVGKSARTLLEMIDATLDLSRLESGRTPLATCEVSVPALLLELEAETRELRDKPAVDYRWTVATPPPTMHTDPVKLKVVLKNLVSNALKFTEQGDVTLTVVAANGGVEFEVRDTGVGMTAEAVAVIFEPFRQLDSSSTRRYDGVGLGLYIVRRLLELLGGTITVDSVAGQGSWFRVWLPVTPPPAVRGLEQAVAGR